MPDLILGHPAPDFQATAVGGPYGDGKSVRLSDFAGKPLVLYFYPKDDTPGCTTQACAIRDSWALLQEKAVLFGVSIDSPKSHQKFIQKYQLPFPLLSDESQALVEAYQVWVPKSMYGKTYMGTERSTFLINPEGLLQASFRKVKPAEHVDLLLKALGS
jgi:peroxiredoxin Q/BCP